MCKIRDKSDMETFTGYKVVQVHKGKAYSIHTGIEYKKGPVKAVDIYSLSNEAAPFCRCIEYNQHYAGLTAVYDAVGCAIELLDEIGNIAINLAIARIKLSGELYNGAQANDHIMLGTRIDEVEILK